MEKFACESGDEMSNKEIKLSLVDEDSIFVGAMKRMAENIETGASQLNIQTFSDGQAFMLSKPEAGKEAHIIIVADILSKQSGLDVTNALRELKDNNRFYIILLTQGRSEEEMIYAIKSGVDYYFQRPVNLHGLQATLGRLIERLNNDDFI